MYKENKFFSSVTRGAGYTLGAFLMGSLIVSVAVGRVERKIKQFVKKDEGPINEIIDVVDKVFEKKDPYIEKEDSAN